jgi:hypothetical protein
MFVISENYKHYWKLALFNLSLVSLQHLNSSSFIFRLATFSFSSLTSSFVSYLFILEELDQSYSNKTSLDRQVSAGDRRWAPTKELASQILFGIFGIFT